MLMLLQFISVYAELICISLPMTSLLSQRPW